MQFSDTANKNGVIQRIEQETKLGDGAISGNAQLLIEFTNRVNEWLNITNHWIHQVDGERPYDDENNSNFPIETFSFVDSQFDYKLTTNGEKDSRTIRKVEIRNKATGIYSDADYFYLSDRPENEFGGSKGTPSKYYLNGSSLIFDTKPDSTLCDFFRVTYDRNASLFVVGDTTKTPGFDLVFHPILVYGPVLDWALPIGRTETIAYCKSKIFGTDPEVDKGLKRMMEELYSRRTEQKINKVSRKVKSYS